QIEPDQDATLDVALVRKKRLIAGRPVWRWAVGVALIGSGLLIGGFGVSALANNNHCRDTQPDNGACDLIDTLALGSGLTATGGAPARPGSPLIAWPPRH